MFSESKDRLDKAMMDLFMTPQNNFRVFLNGSLKFGGLGGVAEATNAKDSQEFEDVLKNIILAEEGLRTKYFLGLISEALLSSEILNRLLEVQKLDILDIEGVIHVYYNFISQPCMVCRELGSGMSKRFDTLHSLSTEESGKILRDYLIATTAKDLGIMISFKPQKDGNSKSAYSLVSLKSTNQHFNYKVSFIDLDLKYLNKMEFYYELDQKIVKSYIKMEKMVVFPEPSAASLSFSSGSVLAAATSLVASAIFLRTIATDLVPDALRSHISARLHTLFTRFSSQLTIVIEESDGLTSNQMFEAAALFLGTKISPATRRIKVVKPEKDEELILTVDRSQEVVDFHGGVRVEWVLKSTELNIPSSGKGNAAAARTEHRYFELRFNKKHRDTVLKVYLPHVLKTWKEMKEQRRSVRLHTVDYNGTDYWSSVVLNHPASFKTMAMPEGAKKEIIEDLDRFISTRDYYTRVGKAWKRGYLLYGPPGTGKSSLVAAMANHLKFDVYDLDLREVQCNSDLRRLLIGSANRSILVIEDIDCNVGLQSRESNNQSPEDDKITLSGLLNFMDGLWSSCGDERIVVFTTNHKDRLDPALLRPGRMDVHIHMSYCTFSGFLTLAANYLEIDHHHGHHALYPEIERLLLRVNATPAEVAGELMKSDDADTALANLITFLQNKEKSQ
ncbi:unnamed protein product [Cuscuta campestris]|uniref:AAA+ ATPase domain-containing protein n=1 Tax=Cuscuta campestris TaxID=132261 RepID=A0A484NU74_9ASTE|nr:unnamed protein product [Cuscuta campestris]